MSNDGNLEAGLRKLSKDDLLKHALDLHKIVDNLDDLATFYSQSIGHLVRVHTRFSRTIDGVLWGVRFALDEVTIATEVVEKDYAKDKTFRELKSVVLTKGNISQLEFIEEREEVREDVEEQDEMLTEIEKMLAANSESE